MSQVDMLQTKIENLKDELSRNYGRITPVQRTQMEINIYNFEIQICRIKIDEIRRSRNIDYVEQLEIQKNQLMMQYYEKSIQQRNLMMQRYR